MARSTAMSAKDKGPVEKTSRADLSRRKILAAARTVFARYPYGAASVRKIEKAGGFNYALIRYYFGSKKGLFEAVALELANEYIQHLLPIIREALDHTDQETALNRFVSQLPNASHIALLL